MEGVEVAVNVINSSHSSRKCGACGAAIELEAISCAATSDGSTIDLECDRIPAYCDRCSLQPYDPEERAREKRESREKDALDLAEGRRSPEQLRAENGAFAFPPSRVRIRFGSGGRLR